MESRERGRHALCLLSGYSATCAFAAPCARTRANGRQDSVKCEVGHARFEARRSCWTELMREGASHQDATPTERGALASNVKMETTMQRTALTIVGALLISGMSVQMASASEHHHHMTKANVARHQADFRGAYNQVRPVNVRVAPPALYGTDTDAASFRGVDPSWIGDRDPSLNPAD